MNIAPVKPFNSYSHLSLITNQRVNFRSLKNDAFLIPSQTTKSGDIGDAISKNSGVKMADVDIHKFANKETYVNIKENISGKDAYLLPSNSGNPNDDIMDTLLRADASARSGAKNVIAILPFYPYARQEKRMEQGEPNAARLVSDMLKTAGVNKVIVADIHNVAIDGFTDRKMPMINVSSMNKIKDKLLNDEKLNPNDTVVVSPDMGGSKRAGALAKAMNCETAVICKTRAAHNQAKAEFIVGEVQGKNCIIYDDMIDTAGTISEATKMLKKNGADKIYVCATHGLFNGKAFENLSKAPIEKIIVTNTLDTSNAPLNNIERVDISDSLVDEMKKITP